MADSTLLSVSQCTASRSQDERSKPRIWRGAIRADFVDLKHFKMQHDLLRTGAVELMFRYNFRPPSSAGRCAW